MAGVGKCYHVYDKPSDRLKQTFLGWRRHYYREFWALRNVSFEVHRGESVGIVGVNGSGKSTLLQIIAGTLTPTQGTVAVRGRVGALLELGSGFNPDFTGRENVYLAGAILGLSRREVDDRFDDIAGFADIGDFLDQPVKTYSSGMMVRLAFSVQVQASPELLIIDEALAVGDNLFQKRCYRRLAEMRERGITLLFVSHAQEAVRTLTTRAVLLHHGAVRAVGDPGEVLLDYRRLLHAEERRWLDARLAHDAAKRHDAPAAPPAREAGASSEALDRLAFGDLDAEITTVEIRGPSGEPCSVFHAGDLMRFHIGFRVSRRMSGLNVALRIRSKEGVKVYSWGTLNQDIAVWAGRAQGPVTWERVFEPGSYNALFECRCALGTNFYEVQAAVSEERDRYYQDQRILHWRDEAAFFQVLVEQREYFFGGLCDLGMKAVVSD